MKKALKPVHWSLRHSTIYGSFPRMFKEDTITHGSGNVFADLGFPSPMEHQTKAMLVSRIADIIEERHMTQVEAAEVLGIDQPKVSALLHGRFRGFSVYRLMCFIAALGHDVEVVTKKPRRRIQSEETGHIIVR